ncbi:dipeptide/oligopeptide/nickel ABC transporter permease/ATP-binding protein [Subtercola sp. PAMC28395]|uniref:dipeptide/oligopeptide/nickel ABC transporter permease/ATP-binding protein n=1 Tax=Subtercola sp. PAMC28395 TaxID=2846775 RepID=UPI001C0DCE29|nr:dipeptide/oligopeptide/nickel ABC transporter permease/ATP-binding protein [Subtercola sp. PAMC28395]QWT24730.1 dipeptide/oligopeptide/nickel ABC transporter permease/ATP-binding protein [Subtercola sp. PAMC28395]
MRRFMLRLQALGLRIRAMPLGSKIALVFFAIVVIVAVFAPVFAMHDPLESGIPAQPPSPDHWFGTDRGGRDIYSRLVYGARYSLAIGLGATALALVVAAVLGSLAATARKAISETIMRILDIVMSFPGIALAVVFVAVFGKSLPVLICTLAFLYVPQLTRIVRANVLTQFGEDYVSAGKVMGARTSYVLIKHVARNCAAPVMVFATILVADAIVFEASLSFIGAGVQDPAPSWGNVISYGRNLLLSGGWWATFFPGMLILLTVLALNILAEGLTDAMVRPAARKNTAAVKAVASVEAQVVPLDELTVAGADAPFIRNEPPSLQRHLALLRTNERLRTDRLVYTGAATPLLEVKNLSIRFPERHGDTAVVDNVSFSVRPGETMALVGESGCGKSITSLAIMGLLPPSAVVTGQILFDGEDLLKATPRRRNALRGHDMSMVYQDALSSLNPSMLIRSQLNQLLRRGGTRSAEELLELVGLDAARTLKSYPHELSGGQRQRVLIALALTRSPRLVVADEPTTALDVTVQAQVIDLLNELREKLGFAMVFVSHDLALVAELAHKVTVMYAGQVVESAPTTSLLTRPQHEYTRGLLGSVLSIEDGADRLHQISGTVPSPRDFASGDRFAPRSLSADRERTERPELRLIPGTEHAFASFNPVELPADDELELTR